MRGIRPPHQLRGMQRHACRLLLYVLTYRQRLQKLLRLQRRRLPARGPRPSSRLVLAPSVPSAVPVDSPAPVGGRGSCSGGARRPAIALSPAGVSAASVCGGVLLSDRTLFGSLCVPKNLMCAMGNSTMLLCCMGNSMMHPRAGSAAGALARGPGAKRRQRCSRRSASRSIRSQPRRTARSIASAHQRGVPTNARNVKDGTSGRPSRHRASV